MTANGSLSAGLANAGLGSLLSMQSTIYLVDTTTTSPSSSKTGMSIGIVLGVTFAICLAVIGTICYIRKRAKITQIGNASELPMDSDGEKAVNDLISD